MDIREIPPLSPSHFFHLQVIVKRDSLSKKRPHFLPKPSFLLGEEPFADLAVSWNDKGLDFAVFVSKPWEDSLYPDYFQGDAVELFIDTRDLKTSGGVTRFCHHFLILPEKTEGIRALELSRFRAEDSHPLCDPEEIVVECEKKEKKYTLFIHIPSSCLTGYDPIERNQIGFTYRIHRKGGRAQHFAISSCDYPIEQYPKLWASLHLSESID